MTSEILDLHDIALLLNYERAAYEPRFRHTKLVELANPSAIDKPFSKFPDFKVLGWNEIPKKDGYLFSKDDSTKDETIPDLPSNMLSDEASPNAAQLSTHELENIYWQARGHDGCYRAMSLLQSFFDNYPSTQKLRIRGPKGEDFTTKVCNRVIMEWQLTEPKNVLLAVVKQDSEPKQMSHVSGNEPTMLHAVTGFSKSDDGNVAMVLDLVSMQFGGDVGRSFKSTGMFALESLDMFYDRIEKITKFCDSDKTVNSLRVGPGPDEQWLKTVAQRAKVRWDNRETEHWCGYCGAPGFRDESLKKCSLCKVVYYCGIEHQKAAWPFHKLHCAGKKTGKA